MQFWSGWRRSDEDNALLTLRRYLLAGLVITIPIVVTLYVLGALFSFLEQHIGTKVQVYLGEHFASGAGRPVAVLVGLLLTVAVLVTVGWISSTMVGRRIVAIGEQLVQRTPLVGWVYGPAKQVAKLVLASNQAAFRRVVLVQYPHPGMYAIGFVTAEQIRGASQRVDIDLVNVFVPYSPTPVTGILLLVPRAAVIDLPYTVEQGMKLVISGGVLTPENAVDNEGEV